MIKKGTRVRLIFRNDWYRIPSGTVGVAQGPPKRDGVDGIWVVPVKFKGRRDTVEMALGHLSKV